MKNLQPVVNDLGDEDPSNDITTLAPELERLLSFTHPDDGVPAIFDRKITINGSVEVDNILATKKVITIPGSYNKGSGIANYIAEQQINASVIEVIPEMGVYYDNVEGYNPDLIEDYKYLYYDDDGDGVYNIIFVTDSEGYIGAIGLDYDGNSYFEPHKNILVEKHIIRSTPSASKDSELEILLKYSGHNLINYQDTGDNDNYDGLIMEPTFRDSLFDVWKMDYSGKSSELIELAMRITSHQFIEMLTPLKIFGDIAFQVAAQLAAYVVGKVVGIGLVALFSAAGSSVPGIGTAIGFVVGMLTYWLISSINQIEQAKKRNNYIAYQTTYNENYDADSDKTLSERWWKDEYFSETMTHTLQGTKGGVYSEVKAETDKYIYTGQVILAPPGVEKTTNFGTTIKNIVLDYSQQTRSYLAYSDWGERLNPFFYQVVEYDLGHLTIYTTDPQDHRVKFMRNSIMYLEDQIYAETSSNEDNSYDRIIPYMMAVKPSLQFVDSDSMVAPEFYLNYPIYVDHEEYITDHGDGKLEDEFYHIYKVYDTTNEGTIQLIPEEYITNRPLMSDIVKIEAWLVDTLGNEKYLGDVVNRHEYNNITGEVTFTSDKDLYFNSEINGVKEENKGINGYDAYIVLEFCIEKYRDITVERDDITPEEAQRIATMQSAHQSILEYTYQYTIAERTQERLSEICYTAFITITSTLIVMGATWVLNKAFAGVEANVYANAASKSLTKFGESSKAYGAISKMAEQALMKSGRSLAFNMFKVTCAVITETLEELYVDPMIEAYVTNKLADMGESEISQILWSGLAESGREQFLSSVTSFMRAGFGGRTQVDTNIQPSATNIPNAIESNLKNARATQDAKAQQQLRQEYLKEGISTILMFAGAMAGGLGGSIGTALGNIMMVAGTSVEGIDSIKDMFEAVLKKEPIQPQKTDTLGPKLISELQAYVAANNWVDEDLSDVIEWAQLDETQRPVPTSQMVEEIKDLGSIYGGLVVAVGPVFDEIHIEMYRRAMQEHELELETSELLGKLDMKGNTLSWDPKNPTNPDYLVPRPPKPSLTEDEKILEEFDKAIDELTDEEKELLFNNREYMNPLKFLDWFITNRPKSVYIDSFRKIRGHIKNMDTLSWRTPLDRDHTISRRVKLQFRLMLAAKNLGLLKSKQNFYVVYGLVQKRNLFTGVKLARPILEVGYATSPMSMRRVESYHKRSLSFSVGGVGNIYFAITLFTALKNDGHIPRNARFKDYFEAIPIDMAATKAQRDNLEIFYIIYVNRMNGRFSFSLMENFMFNAMVGSKNNDPRNTRRVVDDMTDIPVDPDEAKFFIFASKENLDSAIRLGLKKVDLMWYFQEGEVTINKLLEYYYPGKDWRTIQKEVITPYLEYLARSGVPHEELVNYFYTNKIHRNIIKKNYKQGSFSVDLAPYSSNQKDLLIRNCLGSLGAYNKILLDDYLKEQFIKMHSQGFITKETLINVLKGSSQLPYISQSRQSPSGLSSMAFYWIFELLFSPDIMDKLSKEDYSVYGGEHGIPMELLRDLNLYIKGDHSFNDGMQRRLRSIISAMFKTTDLSRIYKFLSAGIL